MLVSAGPAPATFAGRNGLIARVETDGIHVAKPDGSGDVRIGGVGRVRDLAWAPKGRRIAFSAYTDAALTTAEIFVLDVRSGSTRQVTHDSPALDFSPSWSPGGHWITFLSYRNDGYAQGIYSVASSGGASKRILTRPNIADAERSPRGALIAYSDYNDVYTVRTNGTGALRIADFPGTSGQLGATQLSWSPDAREIAVRAEVNAPCDGCDQLWTVHRDGSDLEPVTAGPTESPYVYGAPFWAPDGGSIAFCASSMSGFRQLRSVGAEGGNEQVLGPLCSAGGGNSWQPAH